MPFLLIGLAIAASHSYPRRLGWIATVTGAASVFGGVTAYLDNQAIDGFLLALAFSAVSTI